MSGATSVQGGAESIILSAHAESIILSAPPAESMILSARTESSTLSVGSAKLQSTKSCSGKCGDNGGSNRFDIGSGNNNCSDDSNGDGDIDSDSGNGDSGNNKRAESIMLSMGGTESIILSPPSLKP